MAREDVPTRCVEHEVAIVTIQTEMREGFKSLKAIGKANLTLYCLTLTLFSGSMFLGCSMLEESHDAPAPVEIPVEVTEFSGAGQVTIESGDWYRE